MKWIEITVFTTENGIDAVAARFDMLGIQQLVIEESRESIEKFLNETAKYWDFADMDKIVTSDEPCVKAYVADTDSAHDTIQRIETSFNELRGEDVGIDLGSLRTVIRATDEEDWANNWKLYYKPLEIGKRLLIKPSWENVNDTHTRTILELDPGMAFGTGSHQTTRMCLEYIDELTSDNCDVLDLGCGSGILSIAALLLGAKHATAVDIDPIAEKIAYENAAMNKIGKDRYNVLIGDVLTDKNLQSRVSVKKYDVITANIVASVIIALAPFAVNLLKIDAPFITSGIINERAEEVRNALIACGLDVVSEKHDGEWTAFMARKVKA